jgi:hypothetical protein
MQLDEETGDGEAEARAADFAGGGGIDLGEGLEESFLVYEGDTGAGIGDGDEDLRAAIGGGISDGFDGDGAFIGEFGGVGEEVDQHLADASGVGADDGQVGRDDFFELDRFVFGEADGGRHGGGDEVGKVDVLVEGKLHFAGFDLRDIEDVVDELKEVLAGGVDGGEVLLLKVRDGAVNAFEDGRRSQ